MLGNGLDEKWGGDVFPRRCRTQPSNNRCHAVSAQSLTATASTSAIRLVGSQEVSAETGWCVRIGAGGLWGAFGWLWTSRRGIVQMYISRTDGFVWIECPQARPWLITPEQPEAFVRALER
jgi:hypothetical protein